jgi:hypothetical protein
MKGTLQIALVIISLIIIGCRTKIVCGFPGTFEGEGLKSELIRIESVGIMDTVLALLNTKVTYIREIEEEIKEKNGIGVNVLVKKSGNEGMLIGGITDSDSKYQTFLEAGTYDIEYHYAGCNPIILKNVQLISGEIKDTDVRLGIQGKEITKYEIDLTGK